MSVDIYARKTACKVIEQSYNPTTATVSQKQKYSDCVDLLYPKDCLVVDVFIIKGLIVLGFILFIGRVYKGKGKYVWDTWGEVYLEALLISFLVPLCLLIVYILVLFVFFW